MRVPQSRNMLVLGDLKDRNQAGKSEKRAAKTAKGAYVSLFTGSLAAHLYERGSGQLVDGLRDLAGPCDAADQVRDDVGNVAVAHDAEARVQGCTRPWQAPSV